MYILISSSIISFLTIIIYYKKLLHKKKLIELKQYDDILNNYIINRSNIKDKSYSTIIKEACR